MHSKGWLPDLRESVPEWRLAEGLSNHYKDLYTYEKGQRNPRRKGRWRVVFSHIFQQGKFNRRIKIQILICIWPYR